MRYLGLLDLAGIQDTIERESELSKIRSVSNNIEDLTRRDESPGACGLFRRVIADCGATLLIAAGGNASFWADSAETVQSVLRGVSLEMEKRAEGLEVVGAIRAFEENTLAIEYRKGLRELERRKLTQGRSTRFTFAGLEPFRPAAVGTEENDEPPEGQPSRGDSALIEPKDFDDVIARGFRLPPSPGGTAHPSALAPETLGREVLERTGLMAVVSMDGLDMGVRLNQWLLKMEKERPPDHVFGEKFEAWSDSVRCRWDHAWQQSCDELEAAFGPDRILRHAFRPELCLKPMFAPFARIYQGGDDLRFVCDARIALALTSSMMRSLECAGVGADVDPIFEGLTASAGIVFVDSHFPFSRASRIADNIRKNAKKQVLEAEPSASPTPSCMDWWLNRQGSMEEEERTTRRAARPLQTRDVPYEVAWDCLARYVLPNLWEMFAGRHNKLKDLLSAAEEGPGAVRRLLSLRPLAEYRDLSPCTPPRYEPLTGFNPDGNKTFLRDAAELYDLHFPFGELARKATAWPEIASNEEEQTCSSH